MALLTVAMIGVFVHAAARPTLDELGGGSKYGFFGSRLAST